MCIVLAVGEHINLIKSQRIEVFRERLKNRGEKQYLSYCLSGKVFMLLVHYPRLCHGFLSLCSVASFRRILSTCENLIMISLTV